jgi:CRP/FNR family transcriptional regulator, cyclic AMP receptor protein
MNSHKTRLTDLLQGIPLFAGVSPAVMDGLLDQCTRCKSEAGTFLFYRGDPAETFFLLLSGKVVIMLSSPDGRELIINEMHAGDFFGELGLLTGQPRSADALVREKAEVIMIPRQAFLAALDNEPRLARRLLEATATRLSRTSEFEDALAFLDAQSRLARVLLEMDERDEAQERGYITVSQEELAQRAGLIRQTVAKTLGQWRRRGWLLTGRGHIMLLNRSALHLWFKERAGDS